MNVNGQRRNKSRLPVPSKKAAVTTAHSIMMTTTVTPAKLEKTKNNKSNLLFSTTCSRMAQELKNYNNKNPINNNRRLSSTYSFSKMNKLPTKTLTIDKKRKSTPIKNVGTTTTTTTTTTINRRKSPITQLKEDLENLRQKNAEDKNLVEKQSKEIAKLKKLLACKAELNKTSDNARAQIENTADNDKLQKELGQQLTEKHKLQTQIDLVTKRTQKLQTIAVNQLEVTQVSSDTHISNQITELQKQLQTKEEDFKNQMVQYENLIDQREQSIQKQRKMLDQQKSDHANQIAQLNSIHAKTMDRFQTEHEHNLADLKQRLRTNNQQKKKDNDVGIDAALEQILLEFEQKQHNHAPLKPLVYQGRQHNLPMHRHINQQWYTQQYMPIDALSWPAPQPLPNLKRQLQTR